jgi:hypothetical protein
VPDAHGAAKTGIIKPGVILSIVRS